MAENVGMTGVHGQRPRSHRSTDLARLRVRIVGILATAVRIVGHLAAALLAVYVVLVVGDANPDNGITRFVAYWAKPLALGFQDLFMPADPKTAVLVNYGLAALFWLLITSMALRVLRSLL